MPNVSLYIPCYNAEEHIARCLEGALSQTQEPYEILVVDDGSRDGTIEIVSRYPVRIVRHEKNRGLAAARNTGIRSASGDLIAALDADCVPRADWLERLLECLGDGSVGGAGGRLVELNCSKLPDRWRTLHMRQHRGDDLIVNPPFLYGHSNVFRKSALEKAGPYNENLRTNGEDYEMSQRLRRAGFSLVYQPKAVVEHLKADTIPSVLRAYWRYNFFGYWNDMNLRNTLRQVRNHIRHELGELLSADLEESGLACAFLSFLAIGYAVVADSRYCLRYHGQAKLFDL